MWGVPWGIFWHLNELTQNDPVGGTEVTNLIQDFKNSGATIQTNTDLVSWLTERDAGGGNSADGWKLLLQVAGEGCLFGKRRAGFSSDGELAGGGCGSRIWERRMRST